MDNKQNYSTKGSLPCPECDTILTLPSQVILGKVLECPACGTESEIVSLSPLKLSPLEEEK